MGFSINGDISAFTLINSQYNKEELAKVEIFFILLCTYHEVFPNTKNNRIVYQGSSFDDLALVRRAQQLGFEFQSKRFGTLYIRN